MNVLVVVVYITTTKANTNATNNYPIYPRQVAHEARWQAQQPKAREEILQAEVSRLDPWMKWKGKCVEAKGKQQPLILEEA